MTMNNKGRAAEIMECRSAFAMFLDEGMNAVKVAFPEKVDFVEKNKEKTLEEITKEFSDELESLKGSDNVS